MSDHLFTCYIENPLVIISINIGYWGIMVISQLYKFGKMLKVVIKGNGVGGWGKRFGGCWGLWPLYMFGCISVVVVEGACDRDCKRLGLCTVSSVG
jgi:hypothetical protein